MRDLKFILSAAAILLAGALTAGLTARAVVSPRTGEVQSAGVVTIPTVLGQSAEEVLFYPWSMYDTQPLRCLTDDELLYNLGLDALGATIDDVSHALSGLDSSDLAEFGTFLQVLGSFELIMPLSIQWDGIIAALEWNLDEDGGAPAAGEQIFLKDFPARSRREGQVPVTLSFATDGVSLSFLIRPAQAEMFTGEEQAAALERVKNDLFALLSAGYDAELPNSVWEEPPAGNAAADPPGIALRRLIQTFFEYNYRLGVGGVEPINDFLNDRAYMADKAGIAPEDFKSMAVDELLSILEITVGWNIQIVTTQQQILVLFTQPGGAVFGVYYDIQLGCYSGIGVSR